jgi:hypothetical protein
MPAEQVRPGVPQALPRQRNRYVVSFMVLEWDPILAFDSVCCQVPGVDGAGISIWFGAHHY